MNKSLPAACAHISTWLAKAVSHNRQPSPCWILPSWFKCSSFQIYFYTFTDIFARPGVSPAQHKQLQWYFYPPWTQLTQFCALMQLPNAHIPLIQPLPMWPLCILRLMSPLEGLFMPCLCYSLKKQCVCLTVKDIVGFLLADFPSTGIHVFLTFNQWCTPYRGTVD